LYFFFFFFFSSRRRHTRSKRDWSSDVCSSDLLPLTLFLFRFGFAWRLLSWDQFTGPRLCPKTAHRTALLLEQGHQNQPYALPKRSEERRVGKECRSRRWGGV